jgi:phosphoribosylanthranilate isomerase
VSSGRVRIKFCGMTRLEDAQAAADLGVDAIGLVLTRRSKRFPGIDNARRIRRSLPPFVATVALFWNDDPAFIVEAIAAIRPDLLQFHGSEEAPDCVRYGLPYLKAIGMSGSPVDVSTLIAAHPQAAGILFDGNASGEQGGAGHAFDWSRVPRDCGKPVLLAGGLASENVGDAIRAVSPYAVDVASGIESAPGIKDRDKMQRFIAAVRSSE